ncbi:MAG: nucleotidyltransferase domain-containing protein [Candidatus Pacearchaeota archaeon]
MKKGNKSVNKKIDNKKIGEILKKAYSKISFSKEEENLIAREIEKFRQEIQKKFRYGKVLVGGSLAKGTILKKARLDVDIFLIFDKKFENKDIAALSYDLLKKVTRQKLQILHGSRDYFVLNYKSKIGNIAIEIVPALNVKPTEAKNSIDISPHHVNFIKQALSEKQKQEVKLLKAFVHSIGCYGAESYIRGFSGYSLELLIAKYGSFINLLRNALKWKKAALPIYIDIAKHYASKQDALKKINASKLSPILLVDPVQPSRNALAALSNECFNKFINSCEAFLKKPSLAFFEKKSLDREKLTRKARQKKARLIWIEASMKAKADVAGAKALKFYKEIKRLVEKNSLLIDSGFEFDETKNSAKIFFMLKELKLLNIRGPPLSLKEAVIRFKEAHKSTFVKGKFIYAKQKPKSINKEIKKIAQHESYKIRRLNLSIT